VRVRIVLQVLMSQQQRRVLLAVQAISPLLLSPLLATLALQELTLQELDQLLALFVLLECIAPMQPRSLAHLVQREHIVDLAQQLVRLALQELISLLLDKHLAPTVLQAVIVQAQRPVSYVLLDITLQSRSQQLVLSVLLEHTKVYQDRPAAPSVLQELSLVPLPPPAALHVQRALIHIVPECLLAFLALLELTQRPLDKARAQTVQREVSAAPPPLVNNVHQGLSQALRSPRTVLLAA